MVSYFVKVLPLAQPLYRGLTPVKKKGASVTPRHSLVFWSMLVRKDPVTACMTLCSTAYKKVHACQAAKSRHCQEAQQPSKVREKPLPYSSSHDKCMLGQRCTSGQTPHVSCASRTLSLVNSCPWFVVPLGCFWWVMGADCSSQYVYVPGRYGRSWHGV